MKLIKDLYNKIVKLPILFFVIISLFLCSCGLDVFYYLEPPYDAVMPTEDPVSHLYQFKTADTQNDSVEFYKGTQVYYRIYSNVSTLNSHISSINTVNKDYSDAGFNKLLSYGYKPMKSDQNETLFLPNINNNLKIEIRLTKTTLDKGYEVGIFKNSVKIAIPNRYDSSINDESIFDFDEESENENIPLETDLDYEYVSGATEWYVNAYAVSMGIDSSYSSFYSKVLHLGNIKFTKYL